MSTGHADPLTFPASLRQRRPTAPIRAALDYFGEAVGVLSGSLSAGRLMRMARHRTGLSDFGDIAFEEPLEILIRSYVDEADLSLLGQVATRWDLLRFLSNLLLLRHAEKDCPAILEEKIEAPIFITGMPRSATTFLHDLLSQDPANDVVRCWETIYPCPLRSNARADSRRAKVDRHLASFARMAPEIRGVHPITASTPQECTEITGHVFRSLRFDTTHRVPTYRTWLDQAGHLLAFRFHARFLKHLQHKRGARRWILKSPDHVFALSAIRAVYPDAQFIFMHRSPVEVLSSVARLTEVLRRPFTRDIDRAEIGRQISERWKHGAAILIEEAANQDNRSAHLSFSTVVRDPLGSAAMIYRRFGLTWGDDLMAELSRYISQQAAGGYKHGEVRLEDYGLDRASEHRRFGDYMECFSL
jgi:hypothetical protein